MTKSLRHAFLQLIAISMVVSFGCSDDDNSVDPGDRLCGGSPGFAASISGTPEPVEMCVSNENTAVTYTPAGGGQPAGMFETLSTFTDGDLTIQISTMFYEHAKTPQVLTVTGNRAQAEFDPDGFWVEYREIKDGDYDFTSTTVAGSATLSFNDPTVAVVTFANLDISLTDTATSSTDAGNRMISEGYINVTVD